MYDNKTYMTISARDAESIAYRFPGVYKVFWKGKDHGFIVVERQTLSLYRKGGRIWKELKDYEPVLHYGTDCGINALTAKGKVGKYGMDDLMLMVREVNE